MGMQERDLEGPMRKALSASIGAMVFVAACGTKPLPTSGGGLGGINGRDQISALWDTSGTALTSSGEVESGYQFTVSFKTVAGGCLSPDYEIGRASCRERV